MFLIYFTNNLILVALFYWYNKKTFIQNTFCKNHSLILLVFILLKSTSNLYNSFPINSVFTILTYFGISYIFFKGSFTKKALFIGFFLIASFISEINSYVLLNALCKQYGLQNNSLFYLLIGNGFSRIILVIIVFLITRINDIKGIIDDKGFRYLIVFPIISLFILFSVIHSDLLNISPTIGLLISLGIIIFNIFICTGFAEIIKSKNIQIENEKFKRQELYYLLIEEKIENSKKFIHDFKKHVNIIDGYVKNQDIEKLKSYLNELSTEIKNDENFIVTGNQIIDLSLNANKNALTANSIDIKYDIKTKDIYPVSEFDFNIVFSNILENAIESCIRTNGHFIKIKLDNINQLLVLKVINPCNEMKKDFETLKENNEFHGYGIKNVIKIAKKYNGSADFKFDKDNCMFISTIIFNKIWEYK